MKRNMFRIFAALFSLAFSLVAHAYTFEAGGLYYNILSYSDLEVEVTFDDNTYNAYSGDIVIPETVDYDGQTYTVTAIGSEAFANDTNLTGIEIPNTVETIGERAFTFSGITEIKIPDSVVFIGNDAFHHCSGLKNISIGKSFQQTENYTIFSSCPIETATLNCAYVPNAFLCFNETLKRVTFGNNVNTIGILSFEECTALETVEFSNSVSVIARSAFSRCKSLAEVNLPESLLEIGERAFEECENIASMVLPRSLKKIGSSAFIKCRNLKTVSIDENVTEFGRSIFADSGIETVRIKTAVIPGSLFSNVASLKNVEFNGNLTKIDSYAFLNCTGLERVVLPNTLTEIASDAFSGCSALVEINLPKSMTAIGNDAFEGCQSLKEISVPASVSYLGSYVFSDCSGLINVSLPDAMKVLPAGTFAGCSSLSEIKLPAELIEIEDAAFRNCESLSKIVIPDNVIRIGERAFTDCLNLKELTIGKSLSEAGSLSFNNCPLETVRVNCEEVFMGLLTYCSTLRSLYLGDNVKVIRSSALSWLTSLTSLEISSSVTTIEHQAFMNCNSLESLRIPDSVTEIGNYAFSECSSLKQVVIGQSVDTWGSSVFANCRNIKAAAVNCPIVPDGLFNANPLKYLSLGENVSAIENYAFYCEELTTVVSNAISVPQIKSYSFKYDPADRTLYVPAEAVSSYKDSDWSKYFTRILPIDNSGMGAVIDDTFDSVVVYDLNGRFIMSAKDSQNIRNLRDGIYIINGKKVQVKN